MSAQINLRQILKGFTIMFGVFFLLLAAENLNRFSPIVQKKNAQTSIIAPSAASSPSPVFSFNPPENILAGRFNSTDEGISKTDELNPDLQHFYRIIRSDKIKTNSSNPVLKLETDDESQMIWKESRDYWIEKNDGLLFFLYKTEENGSVIYNENFTGNYQLIFD